MADLAALRLDPILLAAALGGTVDAGFGSPPPSLRIRQRLAMAGGLERHVLLDLQGRRLRCTLWSGPHRCLEHVELDGLESVVCEPERGRLIVRAGGLRATLTRQGAL